MTIEISKIDHLVNHLKERDESVWINEENDVLYAMGNSLREVAELINKNFLLYHVLKDEINVFPSFAKPRLAKLTDFFNQTCISLPNKKLNSNSDISISTTDPTNPHYQELISAVTPKKIISLEKVFSKKPYLIAESGNIRKTTKSETINRLLIYGEHLMTLNQLYKNHIIEKNNVMSVYNDNEHLNWPEWIPESQYAIQREFPFCNITIYDHSGNPVNVDKYDRKGYSPKTKAIFRTTDTISNQCERNIDNLISYTEMFKAHLKNPECLKLDAEVGVSCKVLDELTKYIE